MYEVLSMTNSEWFGPSYKFSKCETQVIFFFPWAKKTPSWFYLDDERVYLQTGRWDPITSVSWRMLVPGENGWRPVHLWPDHQSLVLMPGFNSLIVYNNPVYITQIFLFTLVNRDYSLFLSLSLAFPSVKNTLFLINWCFFYSSSL